MKHSLDRRAVLTQGFAALAMAAVPEMVFGAPKNALTARVDPVVDDYYGTKVTDHYRWMEDPLDADWMPLLRAQNAHTRSMLDAIPGRAALARKISELSGDTAATRAVRAAGSHLFTSNGPWVRTTSSCSR